MLNHPRPSVAQLRLRLLGPALAVALLAACASKPPPPPPPPAIDGTVVASAQINPSVQKRPSPVQVRLFELKSRASFDQADFIALFEREKEVLAADLIGREEFVLRPGESRPYTKTLPADARAIGVAVAFRDLDRATWRVVVPLKPGPNKVTIRLDGVTVTASAE